MKIGKHIKYFNFGLDYLDIKYYPGQITNKEEMNKILIEHLSIKMKLKIKDKLRDRFYPYKFVFI